jgi:cell wall-associated NlpC family hydrolase
LPKKKVRRPIRTVDPQTGKVKTTLQFTEVTKKQPSSKLTQMAAMDSALGKFHHEVRDAGEDNTGVEAANTMTQTAEGGAHTVRSAYRQHRARPYRTAARMERRADRANLSALNKEFAQQNGGFSSNPYSRWQQKRAIRMEYAKAKKTGSSTISASQTTAKAAKRAAEGTEKVGQFLARHKKGFLMVIALMLVVTLFLGLFSSCSMLLQSGVSGVAISTYPSDDADILAAEAAYCAMEDELQSYLDTYESTHDYDEYHYDLDDIEHDPYVLISYLTAYLGGAWTLDEAQSVLDMLFDYQYTLTETVTTETRTRTVTNDNGETETEEYTYYICTVTLENFNLSHVPVYTLTEDQLSMYAMYMATLGNRPDLFPDSEYVGKYTGGTEIDYEIPPEALEDEQFAAMMAEATKYIGYPYVWGGSSPSTSFDCSGFVSWVLNHCGVGWNVGRLGAQGLYNICTPVSSANAQPGDLVFFVGTYDTPGVSHVGIYVGDGVMLHCGDPIKYSNIETSYWQSHLYAFGRLPTP